jgi:transposase InsO family protein
MKRSVEGADKDQATLFPEGLEDWTDEQNPVRAIDVLVDNIDRADLGVGDAEPRFRFRGGDVDEEFERIGRRHGFPEAIRVDQGTEFVSRDLDLWAYSRDVTLDVSRPGKPTDNAFIESFH